MNDSDEEDFCYYGTPLDPYDEDEVPKKKSAFQDITEQYALDSQGKRRFHGAFTGGFSAGHWNSVGLPEGWTPQSFKSSRTDRMTLTQNPEDFMDDEDRNEFGIAPKQVHTTKDFSCTKRARQKQFHDGPIPGEPVLHSLLEPVHETIAVSILKSMGWRPGSGIGEKISYMEKKTARKYYTCHIPLEFRTTEDNEILDESEGSDDEIAFSKNLFERDDFEPYVATPKVDSFGLGYKGLSRHSILGAYVNPTDHGNNFKQSHLMTNDKGKKVSIRGQAFGVGALEDEDDDIYARDDLSGYDFSLDVSNKMKESHIKNKKATTSLKNILENFVSASNSQLTIKVYPPPALPQGYVPAFENIRKTRFTNIEGISQDTKVIPRDQGLGRHDLTAKQRGTILGECKTNKEINKSVEQIKIPDVQSNEVKIIAITGRNIDFVSKSEKGIKETSKIFDESEEKKIEESGLKIDENINSTTENVINKLQSNTVFRPFARNPAKQERYEKFIAEKQGLLYPSVLHEQSNVKLSNWEKDRELAEFEQAYKLYKPLTGIMKEKFVPAEHQEDLNNPVVITKDKNYCSYASNEKQEAARLGMFGKMTRETKDWKPESLLCKRFNVPEPQNGGYASLSSEKKKVSYSIFEYLETPVHDKNSFLKEHNALKANDINRLSKRFDEKSSDSKKSEIEKKTVVDLSQVQTLEKIKQKRVTVADLFLHEKEKELEILGANKNKSTLSFQKEINKPSALESAEVEETIDHFNKIDLYKAIFLSGSESEGEDEPKISKEKLIDITPKNIERNLSPPKGIFANLNFDRMNSWRKTEENSDSNKEYQELKKDIATQKVLNISVNIDMSDTYGPKLPEKLSKIISHSSDVVTDNSSSNIYDNWVEIDNYNQKPKHNKIKKSKKKKSKSSKHGKHKKKKYK